MNKILKSGLLIGSLALSSYAFADDNHQFDRGRNRERETHPIERVQPQPHVVSPPTPSQHHQEIIKQPQRSPRVEPSPAQEIRNRPAINPDHHTSSIHPHSRGFYRGRYFYSYPVITHYVIGVPIYYDAPVFYNDGDDTVYPLYTIPEDGYSCTVYSDDTQYCEYYDEQY